MSPRKTLPAARNAYRFRGVAVDVIAQLPAAAQKVVRAGGHVVVTVEWEALDGKSGDPSWNITDEVVERACQAFDGLTSSTWEDAAEWERENVRESMRSALAAALTTF